MARAFTEPLSISSQFHFCSLPLRLDSYRGCAFGCSYCFAIQRRGNTAGPAIAASDPKFLERALTRSEAEDSSRSPLVQMLQRRVPIHFGGMSDPFQPAEKKWRVTRDHLKSLARRNYPVVISTKGSLAADAEYKELYRAIGPVVVQFSFSSIHDDISAYTEPTAERPSMLLRAMESLAADGFNVTSRWQPYIPGVSGDSRQFVESMTRAGAKHIALEHLKVPTERKLRTLNGSRNNVLKTAKDAYIAAGAKRDGRELILPASAKIDRVLEVRSQCHAHGVTFGAADNECQYLSDFDACCSGVDQFNGFENVFKYNIGFALRRCFGKQVRYDSIASEWRPGGSIDRYLNSRSRIGKKLGVEGSIQNHIEHKWNQLGASGNPTNFLGIEESSERALDGFRLYRWRQDAVPSEIPRKDFVSVAACARS